MNTQQAWSQVPLPWFEATEFNPTLDPGEEGIRIWVPSHVNLRATDGRIPLFGTVQLRVETLEALGIFDRHPVRAVVVGGIIDGIFEPYVGNALLQAPLFPPEGGSEVREFFSVDLAESAGWRPGPGPLFSFASIGPFVATPKRVELLI